MAKTPPHGDRTTPSPTPAATLILFTQETPARHLFVERSTRLRFAGGATVFPGGRVDPGDMALAARFPQYAAVDAAARVAAIRETLEETGLGIGLPPLSIQHRDAIRAGLSQDRPFADLLDDLGLVLDLGGLVPFARWCPPDNERARANRVFDTRFYIARCAAETMASASVDETENMRLFWASATEMLTMADQGLTRVIFPTRRNLERLATLGDFVQANEQACAIAPELIQPWVENRGGKAHLCIPADRGYPVCSEPLDSAMRG